MIIKLDELHNVLEDGVNKGLLEGLTFDDERTFKFTVKLTGCEYKIIWWINCSWIYTQCGMQNIFESVKISSTWPNRFKTNLQFKNKNEFCIAIPIEEYPANNE